MIYNTYIHVLYIICYSFFVVVMAWRGNAIDNFGMVVSPFQVNEPPLRGNCSAFPLNGTAATTKFNANCTEFWDQHLPIRYQVIYTAAVFVGIMSLIVHETS